MQFPPHVFTPSRVHLHSQVIALLKFFAIAFKSKYLLALLRIFEIFRETFVFHEPSLDWRKGKQTSQQFAAKPLVQEIQDKFPEAWRRYHSYIYIGDVWRVVSILPKCWDEAKNLGKKSFATNFHKYLGASQETTGMQAKSKNTFRKGVSRNQKRSAIVLIWFTAVSLY